MTFSEVVSERSLDTTATHRQERLSQLVKERDFLLAVIHSFRTYLPTPTFTICVKNTPGYQEMSKSTLLSLALPPALRRELQGHLLPDVAAQIAAKSYLGPRASSSSTRSLDPTADPMARPTSPPVAARPVKTAPPDELAAPSLRAPAVSQSSGIVRPFSVPSDVARRESTASQESAVALAVPMDAAHDSLRSYRPSDASHSISTLMKRALELQKRSERLYSHAHKVDASATLAARPSAAGDIEKAAS